MEKKVKIALKNGTEVFLADLKESQLNDVKLDTKDNLTWLAMKSEVVEETATHNIERRLYKWVKMPTIVLYEVKYGKTLAILEKDLGNATVYALAMRDFIIAQDKIHNGISSANPEESARKATEKLVANLRTIGQHKAADEIEATMAKVNAVKKGLKEHGFGK